MLRNTRYKIRCILHAALFLLFTCWIGCAGPDYNPVYFPGADGNKGTNSPPSPGGGVSPPSSTPCSNIQLTAKLCVKIKGGKGNMKIGITEPLCVDTPPIPIEINGEKISMKGSDFPDIPVQADIAGGKIPIIINGKGSGDGSKNSGEGSWTPEGDILIQNFSLFVKAYGASGEIPSLDFTTGDARKVPDLPDIKGSPVGPDGKTNIVTATVLGHLINDTVDNFLLGASLQASFEGKIDPPLSECAKNSTPSAKQIHIVKIHLDSSGRLSEEPLPEGNILEISKGTYISKDPQDVGPHFEADAYFVATNETDKAVNIEIPSHIGPFYFATEGRTVRTLQPKGNVRFKVTFQPNQNDTPKSGIIKQGFRMGQDRFYLSGIALAQTGSASVNRIDNTGQTTTANVDSVILNPLAVPAGTVKDFFKCKKMTCDKQETLTQCRKCTPPQIDGCALLAVNTQGRPMEEMSAACKPVDTENMPMMNLDLASTNQIPIEPSRQMVAIQNKGVADLEISGSSIEELPGSKSTGQFKLMASAILIGDKLETAQQTPLPFTLPPFQPGVAEKTAFITIAYLPTDLIGFDGKQATIGQDVIDRAILKITTNNGIKKTQLMGRTRIQDVPDLQAYFGAATGLKAKANNQTFAMEEVVANTEDMAVPTFLKLSDTANGGLRITNIHIEGKDASFFEWLDTPEKVAQRQPASGKGKRCSIPIFDPETGQQTNERFDLTFATLAGPGFDLKPGAYSLATMPLFGCVNFHKDPTQTIHQRLFGADLVVNLLKLDAQGKLERNADSSTKQTTFTLHLVAAIDPLQGKMVLRITQTVAAILNPQAPSLTAVSAMREVVQLEKEGRASQKELAVMMGAFIMKPFENGPTAIFRALDTRPSPTNYQDDSLFDFTSLLHDSDLPVGKQGLFHDYDPLPNPLKVNGWRIFTGALSYPGPLSSRSPIGHTDCEEIDPCSPEGLRKFTDSGVGPGGKGACAFFYASGGDYQSPAFAPIINNQRVDFCATRDKPQDLHDMEKGHYSVDGSITVEDLGLRFWGPTFVHNPAGPLDPRPPALDEVFHIAFTTEVLKPKTSPEEYNVIPDEKVDIGKQEYKINLTLPEGAMPAICPRNTLNRTIGGRKYSSWRFFAPLLTEDEAGLIPSGCPEEGRNHFKGGTAYLRGRRLDPATGILTVVSVAKFGSKEDLTLAFKNVPIFIALNGWLCNPQGDEKDFEGSRCFDLPLNERDAKSQISIMDE